MTDLYDAPPLTEDPADAQDISVNDTVTRRWTTENPELGTGPIPIERFISPEHFQRERDEVFAKSWINVGSRHDFQGTKSFFVRDIDILGVSLLVVQDETGQVQAYYNACSHRGMKLVWEDKGPCPRMFACRFHGWAYDAKDGALVDVPDRGQFYFEDDDKLGLVPVRTETWNGFIFVNLDDDTEISLAEHLGPLGERLADFPFDKITLQYRYVVSEKANWKVALDAQNEIYHVPMLAPVHRFLSGGAFHTNDDGYTRLHDFARLGLHSVYTSASDPDFEDTTSGKLLAAAHPDYAQLQLPLQVPFAFHVVFPNMVLAFFNNSMFTYNIWPIAENQTVWEIRLHYLEPTTLGERLINEQAKCRFRDLLCEDQVGHEAIQTGLTTRFRDTFVVGEQEVQIRTFHHTLDAYMNGVKR